MSVERKQSALDAEHTDWCSDADLSELFAAQTSTAFHNLVLLKHDLGHDSDDRREARPESSPSLDTCEQLSRRKSANSSNLHEPPFRPPVSPGPESSDSDFSEKTGKPSYGTNGHGRDSSTDESSRASQAAEALRASLGKSRKIQKLVIELIKVGEVAHAARLARCMQQSVQLECPTMAGGCGSDDNYVPISCDSRLCARCMNRSMGRNIDKYLGQIETMDWATLLTLTIENVDDLKAGKEAVQDAFGKLRERTIPVEGERGKKDWVWKVADDDGEPSNHYWKSALCGAGAHDLARRLQRKYVDEDLQIPWKELVDGGVYGIDILQTEENEDGTYNVHIHAICEMPYIPQAALSSVWEDLTGAPVVDVQRIEEGGDFDSESALAEVLGYVTKPPEFESIEDEVEYLTTLKGARLVQPFGSLHGNTPRVSGLLRCSTCECAPRWWNYKGIVDEAYDNMVMAGSSADGDRPPDEGDESAGMRV